MRGREFQHILSDVPLLELPEPITADGWAKWWSDDEVEEEGSEVSSGAGAEGDD